MGFWGFGWKSISAITRPPLPAPTAGDRQLVRQRILYLTVALSKTFTAGNLEKTDSPIWWKCYVGMMLCSLKVKKLITSINIIPSSEHI